MKMKAVYFQKIQNNRLAELRAEKDFAWCTSEWTAFK